MSILMYNRKHNIVIVIFCCFRFIVVVPCFTFFMQIDLQEINRVHQTVHGSSLNDIAASKSGDFRNMLYKILDPVMSVSILKK